jgi:hypothetical protein
MRQEVTLEENFCGVCLLKKWAMRVENNFKKNQETPGEVYDPHRVKSIR